MYLVRLIPKPVPWLLLFSGLAILALDLAGVLKAPVAWPILLSLAIAAWLAPRAKTLKIKVWEFVVRAGLLSPEEILSNTPQRATQDAGSTETRADSDRTPKADPKILLDEIHSQTDSALEQLATLAGMRLQYRGLDLAQQLMVRGLLERDLDLGIDRLYWAAQHVRHGEEIDEALATWVQTEGLRICQAVQAAAERQNRGTAS